MLAELTYEMKTAAGLHCRIASSDVPMTSMILWGHSIKEIITLVMAKALELGREYRNEIDQAAKSAIDALVALDLPYVPDAIEGTIDEATRDLGYRAVEAILDAILAE